MLVTRQLLFRRALCVTASPSPPAFARRRIEVSDDYGQDLDDATLCDLLSDYLKIDAAPLLVNAAAKGKPAAAAAGAAGAGNTSAAGGKRASASSASAKKAAGSGAGGGAALDGGNGGRISLAEFVAVTSQLLELERVAEVEAAQEATSLCSPETAQARGRALLNLR